jgi:hypothetical protein
MMKREVIHGSVPSSKSTSRLFFVASTVEVWTTNDSCSWSCDNGAYHGEKGDRGKKVTGMYLCSETLFTGMDTPAPKVIPYLHK